MEVRFHQRIYTKDAISDALEAFEEFGTYNTVEDGDYIVVEISEPDDDFSAVLPQEIANYVLANVIEGRRD
ncbi:MAG: hypothetical protein CMH54_06955 [Myxococcales bacterium]|nr:hypothetical protein [Myxococcales bacterium]|tara:strand:- start:3745 stop:3957 length:213 start_codon:yes stop_codon:yes gene_type:complete